VQGTRRMAATRGGAPLPSPRNGIIVVDPLSSYMPQSVPHPANWT
jgi:hypothetical protein